MRSWAAVRVARSAPARSASAGSCSSVHQRRPLVVVRHRDRDPRVGAVAAVHALRGVVVRPVAVAARGARRWRWRPSNASPAYGHATSRAATCRRARRRRAPPAPTASASSGERPVHAADGVREGDADAQRLLADVAGGVRRTRRRPRASALRRVRRHRPGLAVAGHRHRRDARVERRPAAPASMPSERAPRGVIVVHEQVGAAISASSTAVPSDRLGVDAQAALASGSSCSTCPCGSSAARPARSAGRSRPGSPAGASSPHRHGESSTVPVPAPRPAAQRVLDLDDVDAEVAERAGGQRAGPRDADLEHAAWRRGRSRAARRSSGSASRGDERRGVGTERRRRRQPAPRRRGGTGDRDRAPSGRDRAAAASEPRAAICSDSSTCVKSRAMLAGTRFACSAATASSAVLRRQPRGDGGVDLVGPLEAAGRCVQRRRRPSGRRRRHVMQKWSHWSRLAAPTLNQFPSPALVQAHRVERLAEAPAPPALDAAGVGVHRERPLVGGGDRLHRPDVDELALAGAHGVHRRGRRRRPRPSRRAGTRPTVRRLATARDRARR